MVINFYGKVKIDANYQSGGIKFKDSSKKAHCLSFTQIVGQNIPIQVIHEVKEKICTWHDFAIGPIKQNMKDIIIFIIVLIIGYASFMGIALLLIKLFFPFMTAEELEKRNALISIKK
jgi:hypothetical protein